MSQQIYTFSVSESDTKRKQIIEEIKEDCRRQGRSFSFVCIEALIKWKEQQDERRN